MPIDDTPTNVLVKIPILYDVSNIDVKLFGQSYTVSGNVIVVSDTLDVKSFYDAANGTSWIEFKQKDASENDFTAKVKNVSSANAIKDDISGALRLVDGKTYAVGRIGNSNLDASGIFGPNGLLSTDGYAVEWQTYHNIQDLILSYFAERILGHPGALAAISNDNQIRQSIASTDASAPSLPNALDELKTMEEDKIKLIVQQIMNQDLDRFDLPDKGQDGQDPSGYQPLRWLAGDRIHIQMVLKQNTYSLQSPATNPSSLPGGIINAQSESVSTGNPISDQVHYMIFEFTMVDKNL
jgi:hypothetical protein